MFIGIYAGSYVAPFGKLTQLFIEHVNILALTNKSRVRKVRNISTVFLSSSHGLCFGFKRCFIVYNLYDLVKIVVDSGKFSMTLSLQLLNPLTIKVICQEKSIYLEKILNWILIRTCHPQDDLEKI